MSGSVEVLSVRRLTGEGSLRAFVKLRLGAVVIHGAKVIQQPGQRPWIALPQTPGRRKADGSGCGWFPTIEIISPDLLERVRCAVLDAWEADQ